MPWLPFSVVGLLVFDLLGDLLLATHRVDGHRRALQREQVQQIGNSDDRVGFLRHLGLAEHKALTRARPCEAWLRHDAEIM